MRNREYYIFWKYFTNNFLITKGNYYLYFGDTGGYHLNQLLEANITGTRTS